MGKTVVHARCSEQAAKTARGQRADLRQHIDPEAGAVVVGGSSVQVLHNPYWPGRLVDEQQTPWPRQGRYAKSRRE